MNNESDSKSLSDFLDRFHPENPKLFASMDECQRRVDLMISVMMDNEMIHLVIDS